ncbi:LysR family transcriptional regulator [Sphingobium lactosutens]|uniref:HTH lysR-type domain-containing protein n=1 Tax=Sphingobium lactosutens DS20 TaxID=1331060 RepID=T0HI46_9SPHN|nr:LysR substrate-binding domain-containing protein [Sphingobium lactosutens]EQB11798.1 hypothetical protein RLDS_21970 [Sphingobium lactosutens DS20]
MRGLDLNLLEPLDALLQTRSVTEAARQLGVSQPTMSGMLRRLRDQFSDPLLVRVGKSLVLTPRAEEMAAEVRQILLRSDRLMQPKRNFTPQDLKRTFRLMVSEYGLCVILPAVFRKISALAPQVTFETVLLDQPNDSVYQGRVDMCLAGNLPGGISNEIASVIRIRKVLDDRFVGIVDQSHPLRGKPTLDKFRHFPYIAPNFPGVHWTKENVGVEGLPHYPPYISVPGFLAIGRLVSGTVSVGIVPEQLASLVTTELGLRSIELPEAFRKIAISLLWHERDEQDPAQRWLRSLIVEECRSIQTRTVDHGSPD